MPELSILAQLSENANGRNKNRHGSQQISNLARFARKPLEGMVPGQDRVKVADLEVADPPGPTGRQNPAQGFGPQADALGKRQQTDAA